ncbi:protein transport Sec1a-like [Rutidosis leptorrhynchoides]|uniref:protein transport Sec1a-like n=1 Tax=Rutidosis leptorrhynchoides TaxID=125765 RepID=UPI003A98D65F
MSCTDSDSSSHGNGDYKTFRQISRDRLLYEMLKSSSSGDARSSWKVLIMDKVTVKVMSASCKMTDITDQGVSLVEDIFKRRQPMPSMDVIYFIQPIKENLIMFLSDMSGREPLYKKAFIYFSCPASKDLISKIKSDMSVLPRIGALREMNLEYFPIESQAFTTDHDRALQDLYSQSAENSRQVDASLNIIAGRISTVFASMKEFPVVWYRAKGMDGSSAATQRDLVPVKLASAVWNCITMYKTTIPNFPQTETCELLIVDRSLDLIAPIIHEWTYDAMCHDLLELDGNKYVQEVVNKPGSEPQKKEFLLEDHDPVWLEMRHLHIAEASEKLSDRMQNFMSKNKAAQLQQRDGSELSTREIQKMVQALPQYNEQMEKLSLHVEIAGKINKAIRDEGLRDLGQVEQDLVFGDAGTKEVINCLRTYQDTKPEYKLRLMMIYAMTHPEKFEGDKATKLMQLAKLPPEDMKVIQNIKLLEGSNSKKKHHGSFSLKFDTQKRNHAIRKDRTGEEETWQLTRFYPMLEELLEKLGKRELPKDEYQCMNSPSSSSQSGSTHSTHDTSARSGAANHPHSRRSRRTATWAKPRSSADGHSSSASTSTSSDFKNMGQRIFVFIIGGATRSELRVCHKLTAKLKREVILGSTSFDDPTQYIAKVKMLSEKGHSR